ncbi:MAG: YbaK/EbsC family protein [Amphritea sp.]
MTISATLDSYLSDKTSSYDMVEHSFSTNAIESGCLSSVPLKQVAKAVVLHDQDHYLVAAIPSMNKLMLPQVEQILGCHAVLAKESELDALFQDCEQGAIPAIGQAFGMNVIWDDALQNEDDIYLEAGDHCHLIHLKNKQFLSLMKKNPHGVISCAPEELYDLTHY